MANNILNIRPVKRGNSKVIIGISGESGSGKTVTALKIARGMVSHPSKIGFLDTENGRGSLYDNILDAPFLIADLYPPFSPNRFSQAIKEFQAAGVEVLIIDSTTHEWEGEGGCDDIANAPKADGTPRKVANWIGAKKEHKGFMNTLLQSDMHIICCIRAREKTDFSNPADPKSLGVKPVCEKNFMFEMTASFMVFDEGTRQTFLKIPDYLKKFFGTGQGYLNEKTGEAIIEWVNAGETEDPVIKKTKSELLMVCQEGEKALLKAWEDLAEDVKVKMKPYSKMLLASAKEYDRQKTEAIITDDTDSENVLESIKVLLDLEGLTISAEERTLIEAIVKNKEVSKYSKALKTLNDNRPKQ